MMSGYPSASPAIAIDLATAVIAVSGENPALLVREGPGEPAAIPSVAFDPARHRTLEEAARAALAGTGLEAGAVEQLEVFGDRFRDPAEFGGAPRALCVAYLALARQAGTTLASGLGWRPVYGFLPWEDWRGGAPPIMARIREAIGCWITDAPDPGTAAARRERARVAFGRNDSEWNPAEAAERWTLLYDCELVAEARRDGWERARQAARALGAEPAPPVVNEETVLGTALALDHRRVLATALGRLRLRLRHRPAIFAAMPRAFTLLHLQQVVEALAGVRLHKQNFRRLALEGGLVEPTGRMENRTGGRPAALYRWQREALRARGRPDGIGLPRASR